MSEISMPGEELLTLAHDLRDRERYEAAAREFVRVIPRLRSEGHHEALIAALADLTYVLARDGELDRAEMAYGQLRHDMVKYLVPLSEFTTGLIEVMLEELRGDLESACERLQSCLDSLGTQITMDDIVTVGHRRASLDCSMGSTVLGSAGMLQTARIVEDHALRTKGPDDGTRVAETYWDHARFLWHMRDEILEELEAGFEIGDADELPVRWLEVVSESFCGLGSGDTIEDAFNQRFLESLYLADSWGPASNELRMKTGLARVVGYNALRRYDALADEAARVAELADLVGDPPMAARLRLIAGHAGPEPDGPDFDR